MTGPWSAMDPLAAGAATDTSSSDSDRENEDESGVPSQNKQDHDVQPPQKKSTLSFEALNRHGYSGGPSVLYVPAPRSSESGEQDWSWSSGKRKGENRAEEDEPIERREQTRKAVNDGAIEAASLVLAEYDHAKKQRQEAAAEQRALSYAQKEKRKRDFGQSSRGKNYVEEEKRLLREQGVYSGFDT